MFDIILFSLVSSLLIALLLYLEASTTELDKEVEITDYTKHFFIAFIVNIVAILIFTNMNNKSPFAEQVEVGLLD